MKKTSIVVHAGAGKDSEFIRKYRRQMLKGLQDAISEGHKILKGKGSAIEAVEAAVRSLEDNWLFNAGRGSAINAKGEIEMCASIMNGMNLNSGAVAIVKNVKNPVSLAKAVMINTDYIYLGGDGAMDYAKKIDIELKPDSYFVIPQRYDEFENAQREQFQNISNTAIEQIRQRMHGTVGAVAVDHEGNLAAATSTGGTPNSKEGRIGDSSMIGVGTYASNETCAVSCTGDGEYLIRGVAAHSVAALMRYKGLSLGAACRQVIHKENAAIRGDIGLIAVDRNGHIAVEFKAERMLRAWKHGDTPVVARIYLDK